MEAARNLFETAIEPWYRDNPAVALQRLGAQTPAEVIHWRGTTVTDGTRSGNNQILVEDEHLVRWSRAEPDVVFKNGFAPMALADKRDWDNIQPFNLNKYVGNFRASVAVFVSTTRYSWKDGKASTWRPADWNSETFYEYAITGCDGGIDVNKTIRELCRSTVV